MSNRYRHPCALLKVDAEGVPRLVQHVAYDYRNAWFEVTLFNGTAHVMHIRELGLCSSVDIMTTRISAEAMADAYAAAECAVLQSISNP